MIRYTSAPVDVQLSGCAQWVSAIVRSGHSLSAGATMKTVAKSDFRLWLSLVLLIISGYAMIVRSMGPSANDGDPVAMALIFVGLALIMGSVMRMVWHIVRLPWRT